MWLHVPISLGLLLISTVTARVGDDIDQDIGIADNNIGENRGNTNRHETFGKYLNVKRVVEQRFKRGTSTFLYDWLKLLRTTIWGGWKRIDGQTWKVYYKEGTLDDAVRDFYSLKPTSIEQDGEYLIGKAANQVIILDTRSFIKSLGVVDSEKAKLEGVFNNNKATRQIVYYDKLSEAMMK